MGRAFFYFEAYRIDCPDIEVHWEIQRADGEREMYTIVNGTYSRGGFVGFPDRGITIEGFCLTGYCEADITISPTDMRYNGAMITGVVDIPQCFNSPNVTESFTLNIQGIYT